MATIFNTNKFLPFLTLLITVASLTLGTAKLSWADSLREEMAQFHHFLREHPRIAGDLQRDPWLANNPRYLNSHDNLRHFLRNHPRVRRELAYDPARVIHRSYARDYRRYDDRRYGYGPRYDWWGRR